MAQKPNLSFSGRYLQKKKFRFLGWICLYWALGLKTESQDFVRDFQKEVGVPLRYPLLSSKWCVWQKYVCLIAQNGRDKHSKIGPSWAIVKSSS